MAELTFVPLEGERREKAAKSLSLSSKSMWLEGAVFTVTGYNFVAPDNKPTAVGSPVLVTSIGNMFVSMLTKEHVDVNGGIHRPNGTFNKKVAEIITANHGKSNEEVLIAIVEAVRNLRIVVHRKGIRRQGVGYNFDATYPEFDFVTE